MATHKDIEDKFIYATNAQLKKLHLLNKQTPLDLSSWGYERLGNPPDKQLNICGNWASMFMMILPDGSSHT